jgi:hypothetical protein
MWKQKKQSEIQTAAAQLKIDNLQDDANHTTEK